MKVVVIVYDRLDNIKQWFHCWQLSEKNGELIIIQNYDGKEDIKDYCEANGIKYIRRGNIGLDIGAFKDVVSGVINIGEWDSLLWCCDDTFPMRKDFITPFKEKLINDVGVVCTDLSPYVKTHIRTTGFAIKKETAQRIKFTPITTKEDCYQFEHRNKDSFYEQIIRMGLKVIQVDARETSPLWDSGYKRRLLRGIELEKAFPTNKKVTFICPIYNSYPQIISSLILQTYQNWELLLIHDGPNETGIKEMVTDNRIKYSETSKRLGMWGHYIRAQSLKELSSTDYVVITNADNYHAPVFTEYLINGFLNNPQSVACYCSEMVHSYKAWQVIPCSLRLGFIDCACVMVKADVAKEVGWNDTESHSSDWTYFSDIIKKYGVDRWTKVRGALLTHN